ncbi:PsbP domain-containing protein 1, chloroplastic [Sesamum alatum]|uniref:PsbP domain-containing protein 1, chloroplastic n=1 Tax=Sesamum alatum TaxID=300844 RepID=A0AAE1YC89_9LAMI|nr:PsbP domain-containing protein 1, chloroplastic [Sesamum alatum]
MSVISSAALTVSQNLNPSARFASLPSSTSVFFSYNACNRAGLGLSCNCLSGLGAPELAFGPKKLPEVGRSIGETGDSFQQSKDFTVPRRNAMALILSGFIFSQAGLDNVAVAQSIGFREYIDTFDGYSFKYPQNWIQVRGAGADIFFRDPFVLDENLSVNISSPSSSRYKTVEDLGSPEEAGKNVLRQYLTEFMSTRLGVRRESSILSTTSKVADDGKLYYEVEVNIKSYANNNELAVMPQDRVARLEWDRRYLSVLGVENNRLYELRLQTPEKSFAEEENDIREVMNSFRVNKVVA